MKRALITIVAVLLCVPSVAVNVRADWSRQESNTLAWLHAVYFTDEKNGWIVGSRGTYLTTRDGGQTWKQAPKITNDNIRDVYFSDATSGWLLCERDNFGASGP